MNESNVPPNLSVAHVAPYEVLVGERQPKVNRQCFLDRKPSTFYKESIIEAPTIPIFFLK